MAVQRRSYVARHPWRSLLIVTAFTIVSTVWLLPAPAQAATESFTTPGTPETFEVPTGVQCVTFDVRGAQGGIPGDEEAAAGLGARATVTIPVSPGDSFQINVGGVGQPGSTTGDGGLNGGGDGAADAGGGGGASDVRAGGTGLADRLIVAAGGGGGGSDGLSGSGGAGGSGGETGEDGGNASGGAPATAGFGGASGGSGGAGGSVGGTTGVAGEGGDGGTAQSGGSGGGGGGGLVGGGGGGAAEVGSSGGGGGGGGGSSAGPTGTAFTTGAETGDGQVTVTYTPGDVSCLPAPEAPVAPGPVGSGPVAAEPVFTG